MFVHIMEYKYSNLLILPLNEKGSLNSLLLDSSLMMFCKMNLVASYQKWLCMILLYTIRNVEPVLSLVPLVKAFALPGLSKRATPKAPRLCTYIDSTIDNERQNRSKPMRAVYNTPHEAFPLLCSWQLCSNCQILTASKPKRTVTPLCIYVHPTFAQLELPVRIWHRKSKKYNRNNKTFSKKVSKKVVWGDTIVKRRAICGTWFFQQKGWG